MKKRTQSGQGSSLLIATGDPNNSMIHAELSGETALDYMVVNMTASPLAEEARKKLKTQVAELIEEPTTRGFRIKLIL